MHLQKQILQNKDFIIFDIYNVNECVIIILEFYLYYTEMKINIFFDNFDNFQQNIKINHMKFEISIRVCGRHFTTLSFFFSVFVLNC